ncbi:hypothetical protein GPJ56_009842 [Histomonas meleagridis]|uniref:uncharacterized protein n=1 Tax=Histomonas meleagridis TaxID=135588 RepID=UPI003559961B|nr:hypothetical protein GPJ56_009842 [Histomonas meleagridis]KAH0802851.1 hypothetical protein GO595_004358 [Histomonas meleagridis]
MKPKARKTFPVILIILCITLFIISIIQHFGYSSDVLIPTFSSLETNENEVIKSSTRCPICNFTPLYPPTSTRRDVVLAAALTGFKRVEYFLRTLRTTGSRARVILFLDSSTAASDDWLRFFSSCDIEPVYVNYTSQVLHDAPKLSRYYFYKQWLERHIDEVDRVLHTDTFDVIFQSDPFLDIIPNDKLYFTFEPTDLYHSRWTGSWITTCYGIQFFNQYARSPVSCSGVTAGGAKTFLKYIDLLINTPVWNQCFGHSYDQAHHNYLLYTGEFEKNGIEILSMDCNSPYLTMHFCCKKAKCNWTTGVIYGNNSQKAPVLIHQYNRWKELINRNSVMCPAPNKNVLKLVSSDEIPAKIEYLPPVEGNLPEKIAQES